MKFVYVLLLVLKTMKMLKKRIDKIIEDDKDVPYQDNE